MIEQCDMRLGDGVEELVEMVTEVLPPPPTEQPAIEEGNDEANQKTANDENNEKRTDENQQNPEPVETS